MLQLKSVYSTTALFANHDSESYRQQKCLYIRLLNMLKHKIQVRKGIHPYATTYLGPHTNRCLKESTSINWWMQVSDWNPLGIPWNQWISSYLSRSVLAKLGIHTNWYKWSYYFIAGPTNDECCLLSLTVNPTSSKGWNESVWL